MLIELILFLCLGILVGIFTGLVPGLHINMVGSLIASSTLFFLAGVDPGSLIVFVVAMSITHVFIEVIVEVFVVFD